MILKSIFKVRDKLGKAPGQPEEDEKPFLEHLEDLRKMLIRIVLTLMIATIGCFIFNKPLMDLIRYPVKLAGLAEGEEFALPSPIDQELWKQAEKIHEAAAAADPVHRPSFLKAVAGDRGTELRDLVEAYSVFLLAVSLEDDQRETFINAASGPDPTPVAVTATDGKNKDAKKSAEPVSPGVKKYVQILIEDNPNADPKGERSLIRMGTFKPAESFTIAIKISLYAGIVIAFPFLLYFLAEFVLPGLHKHEKKLLLPAMSVGFGLFIIGVTFSYFVVTPRALEFFKEFGDGLGMETDWRIGYYVGFVTQIVLLFGLCFELPVVVMALVKLELLSHTMMKNTRSYAIVAIYMVAALITPTVDILTLNLLAVPMLVLYEICIWLAYFMEKKSARLEAEEKLKRQKDHEAAMAAAQSTVPDHSDTDHDHDHDHEHEHEHEPHPYYDRDHDEHGHPIDHGHGTATNPDESAAPDDDPETVPDHDPLEHDEDISRDPDHQPEEKKTGPETGSPPTDPPSTEDKPTDKK